MVSRILWVSCLVILIGIGVFMYFTYAPHEVLMKSTVAKNSMSSIAKSVSLFKVAQGRYPVSLEELIAKPNDISVDNWPNGGYLTDYLDAWNIPFYYFYSGSGFTVISLGSDMKIGGERESADIVYIENHAAK